MPMTKDEIESFSSFATETLGDAGEELSMEECFLRWQFQRDVRTLFRMIAVRDLQVAPLPAVSAGWFEDFFEKYEDQGPQLADASLVDLASTLKIDTVFTIDGKDFNVYRKDDGSYLTVVPD